MRGRFTKRAAECRTADAVAAVIQRGEQTGQMQAPWQIPRRGADGGKGPHVHDQRPWAVTVILQMLAQQFLGELQPLGYRPPATVTARDR